MNRKINPLYKDHTDFDYDAVTNAIGEGIITDDPRVEFVEKLFQFVANTKLNPKESFIKRRRASRNIGIRFAALAWVINPALFEGTPSATALAKMLGCKSAWPFLRITGEVSRQFGITNRAQDHAWNRRKSTATRKKK